MEAGGHPTGERGSGGLSSPREAENAHERCSHNAAQDSKLCKEKRCATVTHYN